MQQLRWTGYRQNARLLMFVDGGHSWLVDWYAINDAPTEIPALFRYRRRLLPMISPRLTCQRADCAG